MAEPGGIWVFSENRALLSELIAAAERMAEQAGISDGVSAMVIGPRVWAEAVAADNVFWLGEPAGDRAVDDYVPTIAGLLEQGRPRIILIGATRRGRAVAGRIAARLDVTVLTDVQRFTFEDGRLQAQHLIFGGGAVRIDTPLGEPVIATVGPSVFQAPPDAGSPAPVTEVPFIEPPLRARVRERKPREAAAVNLSGARRVVCAGRGVGQREDLAMVEALARALRAEVACTRPLAEGLDWMSRERYIGISGATIRPELYLGVGVSGQAQHMIGMSESRVVVAVNKDTNAPICAQADYIIAEDLYAFVPALIEALNGQR